MECDSVRTAKSLVRSSFSRYLSFASLREGGGCQESLRIPSRAFVVPDEADISKLLCQLWCRVPRRGGAEELMKRKRLHQEDPQAAWEESAVFSPSELVELEEAGGATSKRHDQL